MTSHEAHPSLGCEGCGRALIKAKKIHQGKRYCSTCYPRLFKRRMCNACGNYARLPVFDPSAQCRACKQAAPCVRCAKTNFQVGMQSPYGPVCKACVPYFRPAKTCAVCGSLSQRVTKSTKTGQLTCSKCSATTSGTCASCRRHRVLIVGKNGIRQCRACETLEARKCQGCNLEIPAGRGRECIACSWARTYTARLAINVNGFSSSEFENLFLRFGAWLLSLSGPHKAALRINVHYKFFRELEVVWGTVPRYQELLSHFTATGLRRAESPMRWLVQSGLVSTDELLREQSSELRRVDQVLAEVKAPWPASLLNGYFKVISVRLEQEKSSIRSVRLALRAAASFLITCDLAEDAQPTQKQLEAYWRKTPGQVAAVTGFVNYLNRKYALQLRTKPDGQWLKRVKRSNAESALITLLNENPRGSDFTARWICRGLVYFHGQRVGRKALEYVPKVFEGTSGFEAEVRKAKLWIPAADSYKAAELTAP